LVCSLRHGVNDKQYNKHKHDDSTESLLKLALVKEKGNDARCSYGVQRNSLLARGGVQCRLFTCRWQDEKGGATTTTTTTTTAPTTVSCPALSSFCSPAQLLTDAQIALEKR